jgi:hypothetical protein
MLGFAYYALRSLGSPRLYFRFAIKMAPHYNRVSEATILQASNTHLRMCYRSLRPEGTRLLCEGRMGQIAGAPTLWGLPPATVREVECQALGASACIYDLHWLPMFRPVLRGLCGALLGAGIGFLLGGARISPWCAGLGTLLALAHGYRAQAKAKTGHLLDSAEGYVRSLEELRAQFKEVRRLNIEMEAAQKALLAEMHGRQRAETDLIEAKKLEALGRLAGGIAHDFNNILTVIRVDAKFAREILLKSGDPLKNLDSITEAAERASHLTRRLLTFARRQTVEAREIVLEDYVQQMKDMLAKLAGDQATLEFDLAGEKSTVFIDPGQLEQVLRTRRLGACDRHRSAVRRARVRRSFLRAGPFSAPDRGGQRGSRAAACRERARLSALRRLARLLRGRARAPLPRALSVRRLLGLQPGQESVPAISSTTRPFPRSSSSASATQASGPTTVACDAGISRRSRPSTLARTTTGRADTRRNSCR